MTIEPLAEEDIERIARQWLRAQELVREYLDAELVTGAPGVARLQELLDARILGPDQTYDLQCLGVALGRVLVDAHEGLDWAVHDDEYGRDPTIRYEDSSLVINVLTMISKRVEEGRSVDLSELVEKILTDVKRLAAEVD